MAETTPGLLEATVENRSTIGAESSVRTVNGIQLHVVAAGDESDPLVVLLHGFPEFWYCWREQIEPLVEAGYRVLVPDQRGYNLSDKPRAVRAYRTRECSQDIVGLIESEGRERAHVVGHDWGGLIAWDIALRHPEVVDRLAIVNAPHPTAYRQHLLADPEQLRRSWYAAAFQLPWLPEFVSRVSDFETLERALRETSAPGTFSDSDLERYRHAWGQEGALTGMLNWYRAAARYPPTDVGKMVTSPTLVVWGLDDVALVSSLAAQSLEYCADGRLELLPNASHWVPHERPAQLSNWLLEHLGAAPTRRLAR